MFLLLQMVGAAYACDHVVPPGGDINTAVAAASSGDLICVQGGTFPAVDVTASVTIRGLGCGLTVIHGSGAPAVRVRDQSVTLEDLTVDTDNVHVGIDLASTTPGSTAGQLDSVCIESIHRSGPGAGILSVNSHLVLVDTRFYDNQASDGAAIHSTANDGQPYDLSITRGAMIQNVATTGDGGAIYVDGSVLKLGGVSLTENSAARDGGAVYVQNSADYQLDVFDCTFVGNVAGRDGGAAVFADGDVAMARDILSGNVAAGKGGAVRTSGTATLDVSECTFQSNEASAAGGGFYIGGPSAKLADSTVTSNTCTAGHGGGGSATREATLLSLVDTHFVQNVAALGGGGLDVLGVDLDIGRGTFDGNKATTNVGGAIRQMEPGDTTITGTEFRDNQADLDGGAVFWDSRIPLTSSSLVVRDARFESNGAGRFGGAISATRASSLVLDHDVFWQNLAGASQPGGAVHAIYNHDTRFENSMFCRNEAGRGGAVAVRSSAGTDTVWNNIFYDNRAGIQAGTAYIAGPGHVDVLYNTEAGALSAASGAWYVLAASSVGMQDNAFTYTDTPGGGAVEAGDATSAAAIAAQFTGNVCYDNTAADLGPTLAAQPVTCTPVGAPWFNDPALVRSSLDCEELQPVDFQLPAGYNGSGADPTVVRF